MMSHSLYQTLKKANHQMQIDVLALDWCRPLLSLMPEVNQSISMPVGHARLGIKTRYELGKSLRDQYDMAIILPDSFKSALVPAFAKIPIRRGWRGEQRYFLLNDLRTNKQDYPLMVQRYVALGYMANQLPVAADLPIPHPYLTVQADQVQTTLDKLKLNSYSRPSIGFCPGAEFGPAKRWPHYHYATLAKELISQGYLIQLFGSKKDHATAQSIVDLLDDDQKPYCLNLAGQTSLIEVIHLLSHCAAVVSNDSGLMHISAALQRPLVALYGPSSPKYTPPLAPEDKVRIIRLIEGEGQLLKIKTSQDSSEGYHQSLIKLSPDLVLEALSTLLKP